MITLRDDSLLLLVWIPLLFGIGLLLAARAKATAVSHAVALLGVLAAAGAAVHVVDVVLTRGGFHAVDVGGWVGTRIDTRDGAFPQLVLTPRGVPSLLLIWAMALVCHAVVFARRKLSPSPALHGQMLLAFGFLSLLVLAPTFEVATFAYVAVGVVGSFMLLHTVDNAAEAEARGRLFFAQRLGDVCAVLALVFAHAASGGDMAAFVTQAQKSLDAPWKRPDEGVFAGFAPQELQWAVALFLLLSVLTRVGAGAALLLRRIGAGNFVARVVGYGGAMLVAALLWIAQALPALTFTGDVVEPFAWVALALAALTAVWACASRAVAAIDVLLVSAAACVVVAAVAVFGAPLLVFGAGVLWCVYFALAASSDDIAGMGIHDLGAAGGLERVAPRAHTARVLATVALAGGGITLSLHLWFHTLAATPNTSAFVVLWTVAATLLTLASGRALFRLFSGPAASAAPPQGRASLWGIAVAMITIGLPLAYIPHALLAVLPVATTYTSPFWEMFHFDLLALQERNPDAMALWHALPTWAPSSLVAAVVGTVAAAGVVAVVRFHVSRRPWLGARVTTLADRFSGFTDGGTTVPRAVVESAEHLSRLMAKNLAPALLETLLRRAPAFVATIVAVAVRFVGSGVAQRGWIVIVAVAACATWWWRP